MHVLTADEMRACDERTIEQADLSREDLMENAGFAVAAFAQKQFPQARRVTVLCGKGNNGGDGLVGARYLAAGGRQVRIVLLTSPDELTGEPRSMYEKLPDRLQRTILVMADERDLLAPAFDRIVQNTDLFVDALVGTGFRPPLHGVAADLRHRVASHTADVLSVDLPSGWNADSTEIRTTEAFRSDAVVTFTAPKLAHVFGALTRGPIVVAPIGSPESAVVSTSRLTWTGGSKKIIEVPRAFDSNKGRFGHVLVIGGSPGKAGAPSMTSLGALRAGAGLVTAAIPRSIAATVAGFAPEIMTLPLEDASGGSISLWNLDRVQTEKMLHGIDVLGVGPGIGREPETVEFVHGLIRQTKLPTVLDADGLNAFEGRADLLDGRKRTLVLTPHPGEMARLLGCSVADVERDRRAAARNFAMEHQLTVVLKGWRTLIAHPDGGIAINTSGNPAMAKGGTGDVLTGIIAALIAQFPELVREAVECAVWLHGAAADLYVRTRDEHTMLATDIVRHLSQAILDPVECDGVVWLQEDLR